MIFREEEKGKVVVLLSRGVVWACVGFIAGIAGAFIGSEERIWLFAVGILCAGISAAFLERSKMGTAMVCAVFLLFVVAGFWHSEARMRDFSAHPSAAYFAEHMPGRAEVHGYVADIRKETDRSMQVRIDAREVFYAHKSGAQRMIGSILAFVPLGTPISAGEYVSVRGSLERPKPIENFDYPLQLASQGMGALVYRAELALPASPHEQNPARTFLSSIARVRLHARTILAQLVGGTEGEVLVASALGYPLSLETQQLFSRAGVTHLVAISGMNIALVTGMLILFFLCVGLRRQYATLVSLAGIAFFVLLVGLAASVMRAALMGVLIYSASIIGRPLPILRMLLYAATLMLFFNPYLLFGDVGFQLSFAAMTGILLCASYLDMQLSRIGAPRKDVDWYTQNSVLQKNGFWRLVRGVTALSLAAVLFTAPLTAYHFGIFSLGGIVLNVVAVPLFPLVLIFGFFAVALGSIFLPFGAPAAWAAWLLIFALKRGAEIVGSLPLSYISLPPKELWVLAGGYALVAAFLVWLARRGYNPLLAATRFFFDE